MMNRRHFVCSFAGLGLLAGRRSRAPRITRVSSTAVEGRYRKFIAMNSRSERPLGETYQNTLVRIHTDRGIEGVGVTAGRAPDHAFFKDVRQLLSEDPLTVFHMEDGQVRGVQPRFEELLTRHRHLDGPLLDLVGKLTERPCWQLLGQKARDRVDVYDGTFYFTDIWFEDRGVQGLVAEAKEAVAAGYSSLKLKVGRGRRWMEKAAGLKRDIDVLTAVREALGPAIKIMADANDAYEGDLQGAWSFLERIKDVNLHWIEEIFPEDVDRYTRLRERMSGAGLETLIADGENADTPEHFAPFLQPRRLIDVVQLNIRRGGVLGGRRVAQMAEKARGVAVPHNWGCRLGLYLSLHLAKATPAVAMVEDDRSACDVIVADEGYRFQDGRYTVSDSPGLGLQVDEDVYRDRYQSHEVIV